MEEIVTEATEAVAETLAPIVEETVPVITEVIEVVELADLEMMLAPLVENTDLLLQSSTMIQAFALFFVVVALCYFCYKFFRIFF